MTELICEELYVVIVALSELVGVFGAPQVPKP